MLVEDDSVDAMTVKRALKDLKVTNQLVHTLNGEGALEYLRADGNEKPCVVLLDLNMPKMNGIEFLKIAKVNEQLKTIPVVVLTTSIEQQDKVEAFGLNTYLVRSIPQILTGIEPSAALRVLVEDFEEDETPLGAEHEAKIIARICKRAAVKAGQTLSVDEQRALLNDLEKCQAPRTCPHGRPTMIHLSVDLLERQFGRRGAR